MLITLLIITIMKNDTPQESKKIPTKEVVIQSNKIIIPDIPESTKQAKSNYSINTEKINQSMMDLEKELIYLYASTKIQPEEPASIRVNKTEAEAVRFFNKIINDKIYEKLELEVIKSWNSWQHVVANSGLYEYANSEQKKSTELDSNDQKLIEKSNKLKQTKMAQRWQEEEARAIATNPVTGFDYQYYLRLLETRDKINTMNFNSQKSTMISNQKSPELSLYWAPLAQHLQQCADEFAIFDAPAIPYQNEVTMRLKNQAKIAFLERCRSALWLSQTVWSRMASNPEPPPLRMLAPNPQPTHGNSGAEPPSGQPTPR